MLVTILIVTGISTFIQGRAAEVRVSRHVQVGRAVPGRDVQRAQHRPREPGGVLLRLRTPRPRRARRGAPQSRVRPRPRRRQEHRRQVNGLHGGRHLGLLLARCRKVRKNY